MVKKIRYNKCVVVIDKDKNTIKTTCKLTKNQWKNRPFTASSTGDKEIELKK